MLGSGLGEEVADTETPREAVKSGGDLRRVIVEGATRILTRGGDPGGPLLYTEYLPPLA